MEHEVEQMMQGLVAMGVLLVLAAVLVSFLLYSFGIKLGVAAVGERIGYGKALVVGLLAALLSGLVNSGLVVALGSEWRWMELTQLAAAVLVTALLLGGMEGLGGFKALCASFLAYLFSFIMAILLVIGLAFGLPLIVDQQPHDQQESRIQPPEQGSGPVIIIE